MARRTPALATVSTPVDNILKFDDAPEFLDGASMEEPLEDMDQQVKEAQHRLTSLRAQQEEVERQKQILENLRQKQERFVTGKKDIVEKFDRSLRAIAEALEDARRRVESLSLTQRDFQEHLEQLKGFLPERWHRSQLDQELDRALHALNEAAASYDKGSRRIQADQAAEASALAQVSGGNQESAGSIFLPLGLGSDELLIWARRGFAFTLPLIATIIVAMILAKLMF